MAITIEFHTYGVEIRDDAKATRVFLEPATWECLLEYKHQIEQAFKLKKEQKWQLQKDENTDLKAHTNSYKGQFYLHIRHWWKDHPTKMGVSFSADGWKELKSYMSESEESILGKSVAVQLLREKVSNLIREECEGCEKDWPSQRDHDCLQSRKVAAELWINKAVSKILAIEFIKHLAEEAYKQKVILETPHQTLKRILQFHLGDIKEEVLDYFED